MGEQNDKPQDPQQKIKDALSEMVGAVNVEGAGDTMVTRLDALSSQWRQTWTTVLKHEDPEAHAQYKAKKYFGENANPDLATRKAAYVFVIEHIIGKFYTEIEPLDATPVQVVIVDLVRKAISILKVIAPDDYESVTMMLKADAFDIENRKATYRAIANAFLKNTYKLANV